MFGWSEPLSLALGHVKECPLARETVDSVKAESADAIGDPDGSSRRTTRIELVDPRGGDVPISVAELDREMPRARTTSTQFRRVRASISSRHGSKLSQVS